MSNRIKKLAEKFSESNQLSKRETEILLYLLMQSSKIEIVSRNLFISENTARVHLKNVRSKVGASSTAEIYVQFLKYMEKQQVRVKAPKIETEVA